MLLFALICCVVAPASAVAPVGDVFRGWYLLRTGRPEGAAEQAALALAEDPEDPAAHVLYVVALSRGLREGPAVRRLYREWGRQEPESELASVGLALALVEGRGEGGPWCEEVEDILHPLPEDPRLRARALRVRQRARRWCPGDPDEGFDELRQLAATVPEARSPVLRVDLFDGEISPADAALLELYLADWPDPSWSATALYGDDAGGAGLERARQVVESLVEVQADSGIPELLYFASRSLRVMGQEDRADAIDERRRALDPDAFDAVRYIRGESVSWMAREVGGHWDLWNAVLDARRKRPAPLALLALSRLEDDLPSEATALRAELDDAMADNLWWSLRRRASVERSRQAWSLDPSPRRANRFAYDAALAGIDLDEALAAVDQVLQVGLQWDPRGEESYDDYRSWRQAAGQELCELLDTRAWVLVGLGRWQEARRDLRQAVLVARRPSAVVHLHLGLVEQHLDNPDAALLHLGYGLALGGGSEGRLRRRARQVARQLLRTRRHSPLGLDAWVQASWPLGGQAEGGAAPGAPSAGEGPIDNWLVGQDFPDLELLSPMGTRSRLSDLPGLRVVELWATWCGPCVEGLPHLSKIARDYGPRGVRVLAVSVDKLAATAWDFDEGPRRPHYELVWAGSEAMKQAKVSGIPATFVLDEDGRIRAFFSGYVDGDDRLEQVLETLLAP